KRPTGPKGSNPTMLGMATTLVCSSRQAAALTTGVLIGAGIVLYQMTSLVLAPASNHQIPLSLRTGGHQAALAAGSSAGLTHDVGYPLSYLRATAGPAERPVAQARRGLEPKPVPLVQPIDPPTTLPSDDEKSNYNASRPKDS